MEVQQSKQIDGQNKPPESGPIPSHSSRAKVIKSPFAKLLQERGLTFKRKRAIDESCTDESVLMLDDQILSIDYVAKRLRRAYQDFKMSKAKEQVTKTGAQLEGITPPNSRDGSPLTAQPTNKQQVSTTTNHEIPIYDIPDSPQSTSENNNNKNVLSGDEDAEICVDDEDEDEIMQIKKHIQGDMTPPQENCLRPDDADLMSVIDSVSSSDGADNEDNGNIVERRNNDSELVLSILLSPAGNIPEDDPDSPIDYPINENLAQDAVAARVSDADKATEQRGNTNASQLTPMVSSEKKKRAPNEHYSGSERKKVRFSDQNGQLDATNCQSQRNADFSSSENANMSSQQDFRFSKNIGDPSQTRNSSKQTVRTACLSSSSNKRTSLNSTKVPSSGQLMPVESNQTLSTNTSNDHTISVSQRNSRDRKDKLDNNERADGSQKLTGILKRPQQAIETKRQSSSFGRNIKPVEIKTKTALQGNSYLMAGDGAALLSVQRKSIIAESINDAQSSGNLTTAPCDQAESRKNNAVDYPVISIPESGQNTPSLVIETPRGTRTGVTRSESVGNREKQIHTSLDFCTVSTQGIIRNDNKASNVKENSGSISENSSSGSVTVPAIEGHLATSSKTPPAVEETASVIADNDGDIELPIVTIRKDIFEDDSEPETPSLASNGNVCQQSLNVETTAKVGISTSSATMPIQTLTTGSVSGFPSATSNDDIESAANSWGNVTLPVVGTSGNAITNRSSSNRLTINLLNSSTSFTMMQASSSTLTNESIPTVTVTSESIPSVTSESILTVTSESIPTITSESIPSVTSESIPAVTSESIPTVTSESIPTVTSELIPAVTSESIPTVTSDSIPTLTTESASTMTTVSASTLIPESASTVTTASTLNESNESARISQFLSIMLNSTNEKITEVRGAIESKLQTLSNHPDLDINRAIAHLNDLKTLTFPIFELLETGVIRLERGSALGQIAEVDASIEELADYFEILISATLFLRQCTNQTISFMCQLLNSRLVKLLYYYLIELNEPASESKFYNVTAILATRQTFTRLPTGYLTGLLSQLWDSIQSLRLHGISQRKVAIITHSIVGVQSFRSRLLKMKISFQRLQQMEAEGRNTSQLQNVNLTASAPINRTITGQHPHPMGSGANTTPQQVVAMQQHVSQSYQNATTSGHQPQCNGNATIQQYQGQGYQNTSHQTVPNSYNSSVQQQQSIISQNRNPNVLNTAVSAHQQPQCNGNPTTQQVFRNTSHSSFNLARSSHMPQQYHQTQLANRGRVAAVVPNIQVINHHQQQTGNHHVGRGYPASQVPSNYYASAYRAQQQLQVPPPSTVTSSEATVQVQDDEVICLGQQRTVPQINSQQAVSEGAITISYRGKRIGETPYYAATTPTNSHVGNILNSGATSYTSTPSLGTATLAQLLSDTPAANASVSKSGRPARGKSSSSPRGHVPQILTNSNANSQAFLSPTASLPRNAYSQTSHGARPVVSKTLQASQSRNTQQHQLYADQMQAYSQTSPSINSNGVYQPATQQQLNQPNNYRSASAWATPSVASKDASAYTTHANPGSSYQPVVQQLNHSTNVTSTVNSGRSASSSLATTTVASNYTASNSALSTPSAANAVEDMIQASNTVYYPSPDGTTLIAASCLLTSGQQTSSSLVTTSEVDEFSRWLGRA